MELTATEWRLLDYLAAHCGRVVSIVRGLGYVLRPGAP